MRGFVGSLAVVALMSGCGSGGGKPQAHGGNAGSSAGLGGTPGGTGAGGGRAGQNGEGPGGSGAGGASAGQGGSAAGGGGTGVEPTIVATFDTVPVSLGLDATNLYVTLSGTQGNFDGKVQAVAKTAVGATTGAGTIVTLASGIREAGTIAVAGGTVYWSSPEAVFPNGGAIFAVPAAGGSVTQITPGETTTYSRIAVANSVLYEITANYGSVTAYPLTGGGGAQIIYAGPTYALRGIDTDGTSVFLFAGNAAAMVSIYKLPVGGGAVIDLMQDVASNGSGNSGGDCDLVDDAMTLYWTDTRNAGVYSVSKTGGTAKLLATVELNGACPEIALDGNEIFVLEPSRLSRFPKAGGTPVIMAAGGLRNRLSTADSSVGLVTDDRYVYWLRKEAGQIVKLAK